MKVKEGNNFRRENISLTRSSTWSWYFLSTFVIAFDVSESITKVKNQVKSKVNNLFVICVHLNFVCIFFSVSFLWQ